MQWGGLEVIECKQIGGSGGGYRRGVSPREAGESEVGRKEVGTGTQ